MDPLGLNMIKTAALGRPFKLGMLYDCRKDALIPGLKLWTNDQLELNKSSQSQTNAAFTVIASDSLVEKSKALNINGDLKLSVVCGLIDVGGAASYLKDTKQSFKQQRLTLHYHSSTRFEELTINHSTSGDVLHYDDDVATHVVTAVLYGADACFVFDREVSSDEDKNTVAGEVKVALKKLQGISGGAKIDLNDSQKTALQKFSCKFYGDFQLPSNPTTFEDAVKVFEDLPNLLGENNERVVPLRVYLYPLDKLFSRDVKFQHDISISLTTDIESVMESLNTTEMKCSDLLTDSPALTFKAFQEKINDMKQNCYKYKLSLMRELGSLLPKIRGKFIEDKALTDLLWEHEESPFQRKALEQWLIEKEEESDVIKILLTQLHDSGATTEVNVNKIRMSLEVQHLVSYTFTSLGSSDELLSEQKAYLRTKTKRKCDENTTNSKYKSWLTPEIQKIMRNNLRIFKNVIDSKDRESAKFIVSSKEMEDHPGSCILLYEDECDDAVCFSPPSKPDCPITEEIRGDQVVLKVSPSCPATVEMKLLYKMKKEKDWKSQPVVENQRTVTLTDLRSDTEYDFKCAAVGKLNYTIESDVMRVTTLQILNQPIKKSKLLEDGNPARYRLKTPDNLDESCRKITVWDKDTKKPHKIFLEIGETESGITSFFNTVINYMCGVKREDNTCIEITDEQFKYFNAFFTSKVTYDVYVQESLIDRTIKCRPRYGNISDISRDKEIAEGLLYLYRWDAKKHAISLMNNADQNRLSVIKQYIFDAVQFLFGNDDAENIVLLLTHSTGARPRNSLTAIKEPEDEENQPDLLSD